MGIHDLEDLSLSAIRSLIWLLLSSVTSTHLHFGLWPCQRNHVDWNETLWQHEDFSGGSFSTSSETSRPYPGLSAVGSKIRDGGTCLLKTFSHSFSTKSSFADCTCLKTWSFRGGKSSRKDLVFALPVVPKCSPLFLFIFKQKGQIFTQSSPLIPKESCSLSDMLL